MEPDPSRNNGEVKNALSSKKLVKRATLFINSELYKVTCGMSAQSMVDNLTLLANKRHIPYQLLLKIYLTERIDKELRAL